MAGIRIGAPNSVARHVQERLELDPCAFGQNRWLVYEYATGKSPILRAAQASRSGAESYMKGGRVLVDVNSYRTHQPECSQRFTFGRGKRRR